jgi:hypothetical protein
MPSAFGFRLSVKLPDFDLVDEGRAGGDGHRGVLGELLAVECCAATAETDAGGVDGDFQVGDTAAGALCDVALDRGGERYVPRLALEYFLL